MLRGLAQAGADVVMHGLAPAEELHEKRSSIEQEFGVKTDHSTCDVTKPKEIRCAGSCCGMRHAMASGVFRYGPPLGRSCSLLFAPRPAVVRTLLCTRLCALTPSRPLVCRQMIENVHRDFGRLDILVNNVGIQYVSPVHEFPEDKWDAIIAVCLSSAFHATKAALPFMMEQQWGRIINTGSMHALVASPYKSAYNAAKHGIAGDGGPCMISSPSATCM